MRKKHYLLALACIGVLHACKKDDIHNGHDDADDPNVEYRHIRVLLTDETTADLTLVHPSEGTTSTFTSSLAKSALYSASNSRFAAIVNSAGNKVETYDVGLEMHGDHVDKVGTPKMGLLSGTMSKPTHFKSEKGMLLTFNDGDGTLSYANESDISKAGTSFVTINAGLRAHHGAMAIYDNGTLAVTVKDNSVTGSLPERVKVIDKNGIEKFPSTVATTGIHGNATDGKYAVFGSGSGILVVQDNGIQRLIPHPADFGTAWFGTILETANAGEFVGFTATKGAYLINVVNNTVTPLLANADIMQCKVSMNKKRLALLLLSGDLYVIDLTTKASIKQGNVIGSTERSDAQKPQLEATQKFAYITSPKTGELTWVNLNDFSKKGKLKVSATPYRLTLLGFESNEIH